MSSDKRKREKENAGRNSSPKEARENFCVLCVKKL